MAIIGSILVFIISIPATLSFSSLSHLRFGAGTIFDNMDFIVSNILMPLGALGTTLVVGQLLDKIIKRKLWERQIQPIFTVVLFN